MSVQIEIMMIATVCMRNKHIDYLILIIKLSSFIWLIMNEKLYWDNK